MFLISPIPSSSIPADIKKFKKDHKKELSEELGVTFYRFLDYYTTEIDLKTSALIVESAEFVQINTLEWAFQKSFLLSVWPFK